MRPYLLWRLIGTTPETITQPQRLSEGLALHLRYADLLTVVVQIGERQQAYVALHGCISCGQARCAPSCPVQLLRRLLVACIPGAELQLAMSGLAQRPYRRVVVALPAPTAQPLDGTLLHAWDEARLQLRWHQGRRGLCCAALLAVGADGPDPNGVLQTQGWSPRPIEAWLAHRTLQMPMPHLHALPRRTQLAPVLLPPIPRITTLETRAAPDQQTSVDRVVSLSIAGQLRTLLSEQPGTNDQTAQDGPDVRPDDGTLADWLYGAQHVAHRPSEDVAPIPAAPMDDAEVGMWPAGPYGLTPQAVGQLLRQLATHPAFTQGKQASQIGVVKGRLVKVLGLAEPAALAVLVWLDAAELLAAPLRPEDRWRRPRPLATTDLDMIATRLTATPLPTPEAIQAVTGA
jgi:hypothetical protein